MLDVVKQFKNVIFWKAMQSIQKKNKIGLYIYSTCSNAFSGCFEMHMRDITRIDDKPMHYHEEKDLLFFLKYIWSLRISTVCHKKNVSHFQMKKVWLFFRSIFSKFCIQVDMTFIITHIKSEKSPRMATLTYRHFGNPGRCYHRAHCTIVHRKAWLELFSVHRTCKTLVMRANANLGGPTPRRLVAAQ